MTNVIIDGSLADAGSIGAQGVTPPAIAASIAAVTLTAPTVTVFGFTTTLQFFNLINAVNSIVTALKAQGFMTSP